MSQSPCFFHFSYVQHHENPRIHELRDGNAFGELSLALQLKGYEYGGLIINYPNPDYSPTYNKLSDFKPNDLLVLTTRPPITDTMADHKKYILRTNSELEKGIIESLKKYFDTCTRGKVKIQEEVAKFLLEGYENRSVIEFHIYKEKSDNKEKEKNEEVDYYKARYDRCRDIYRHGEWHHTRGDKNVTLDKNATATYMVITQIENGPRLLNLFAMSGQLTLLWSYLLRTKYSSLLDSLVSLDTPKWQRFVMAEIIAAPKPQSPTTLSFADEWKVDLLIDHTF